MAQLPTTLLLGMNNPLSNDARFALYPYPPGCSGHRLWRMLHDRCGANRGAYLAGYQRGNLLHARVWSQGEARAAGQRLRQQLAAGSGHMVVLVLGVQAWAALDLPPTDWLLPVLVDGITWRRLPHPSGRNPWYNDPANRLVVGMLLEEHLGTAS